MRTLEQSPWAAMLSLLTPRPLLHLCFVVALSVSALNAQTTLGYLQETRTTNPKIPLFPASVGAGTYSHFNLPGYGDVSIKVEPAFVGGNVPAISWGHETQVQFQRTSNNRLNWGTDTDFIVFSDTSVNLASYTVTFYFNALKAPDPANLHLVVLGLARYTTAAVTPGNGINVGEYQIRGLTNSSPTKFNGGTFSSGWIPNVTDPYNTGWDLYRPNSLNLRTLTLNVTQTGGDTIGFTLGYRTCPGLMGNSLDEDFNIRHLYDIDTTTALATNPIVIGPDWHIGYSPFSPTGSLYGLQANGNLFVVNLATGNVTLDKTTAYTTAFGGNLAADPTSLHPEVLYGIERQSGQLFRISPGGTVQILGTVNDGQRFHSYSGMAFDRSGRLFIVDASNGLLLQVDKTNGNVIGAPTALTPLPPSAQVAGLAIHPNGTAYYTQRQNLHGELYTLDLNTGALNAIGPITGAADFGIMAGLAFRESPVNSSGICQGDNNP